MHPWFKGCAKTSAGNTIAPIYIIRRAGKKGDFSGLISHRHDIFMVHHEKCSGMAAEVNLKKKEFKFS